MTTIPRRDFLGTVAATGTGLLLGAAAEAMAQAAPAVKPVELALIGFGSQGRNLADSAARIPGVHFRASATSGPIARSMGPIGSRIMGRRSTSMPTTTRCWTRRKGSTRS